MKVTYDQMTGQYHVADATGSWYATGRTMIEAIQRALSIKLYWLTINK